MRYTLGLVTVRGVRYAKEGRAFGLRWDTSLIFLNQRASKVTGTQRAFVILMNSKISGWFAIKYFIRLQNTLLEPL